MTELSRRGLARTNAAVALSFGAASTLSMIATGLYRVGLIAPFVDEGMTCARRLIAAGVAAELRVIPSALYGFDAVPGISLARRYRENLVTALRLTWGRTRSTRSLALSYYTATIGCILPLDKAKRGCWRVGITPWRCKKARFRLIELV